MRDTILCWTSGHWLWEGEEIPSHLGQWNARIKIGCHWTDKQVNEFVDQYVADFLKDDE